MHHKHTSIDHIEGTKQTNLLAGLLIPCRLRENKGVCPRHAGHMHVCIMQSLAYVCVIVMHKALKLRGVS
jgi:hypothetical protein